jgi:hypothetical protein
MLYSSSDVLLEQWNMSHFGEATHCFVSEAYLVGGLECGTNTVVWRLRCCMYEHILPLLRNIYVPEFR